MYTSIPKYNPVVKKGMYEVTIDGHMVRVSAIDTSSAKWRGFVRAGFQPYGEFWGTATVRTVRPTVRKYND